MKKYKTIVNHNLPIAIQGYEGSFHHQAVEKIFGKNAAILPCSTFYSLIQAVETNKAKAGVMAIENSIAGSILPNYTLLQNSSLQITAELYLPIKQHLLVNAGVNLLDIKEVHSHPMAIQQCMQYLQQFNWKLVDTEDTALSAKHIHIHKAKHIAAIAGKQAANLYGLEIVAANIHTQKNNFTRFLVLQKLTDNNIVANATKASIYFTLPHTKGSLATLLTFIAKADINLCKLQSMPIAGTKFLYAFHADIEFAQHTQFSYLLQQIQQYVTHFKILGQYINSKHEH